MQVQPSSSWVLNLDHFFLHLSFNYAFDNFPATVSSFQWSLIVFFGTIVTSPPCPNTCACFSPSSYLPCHAFFRRMFQIISSHRSWSPIIDHLSYRFSLSASNHALRKEKHQPTLMASPKKSIRSCDLTRNIKP